jgi:hypothetical protein
MHAGPTWHGGIALSLGTAGHSQVDMSLSAFRPAASPRPILRTFFCFKVTSWCGPCDMSGSRQNTHVMCRGAPLAEFQRLPIFDHHQKARIDRQLQLVDSSPLSLMPGAQSSDPSHHCSGVMSPFSE